MTDITPLQLETERLRIRPFVLDDLAVIAVLLDEAFGAQPLAERRQWIEWSVRNYDALARMYQPPYGDYALVRKADGELIGSVGYGQRYGPFGKLPYFRVRAKEPVSDLCTPQFGLFWALGTAHQGQGYATEGARALIDHAFTRLSL
ncbi:MAG: GNAT family N-acetyltransferase, partial [Anaerolineae bacterium]|nr:GNAT family N-acetyltransferase [Anaerolineae bacterium]